MAYVSLCKALYDYVAQADDELNLKEDDTLYILESDDPEWWKAKLRQLNPDGTPIEDDSDQNIGLVPANYMEEAEPIRLSLALYDYTAQTQDELSTVEDELLGVYEIDGPWLLVKKQGNDPLSGGPGRLGYVPANYVDEAAATDTGDAPVSTSFDAGHQLADEQGGGEEQDQYYPQAAVIPKIDMPPSTSIGKGDEIKMWPVSALDSKNKKKKGTLGIGNASLFFASESDKTPVQKISVLHVVNVTIEKGKTLHLQLSPEAGISQSSFDFHAGSKDVANDIMNKIQSSKEKTQAANSAASASASTLTPSITDTPSRSVPLPPPPPPVTSISTTPASATILPPPIRKTVSFQQPPENDSNHQKDATPPTSTNGTESQEHAIALYDFDAQGDDELSVAENEPLVVLEKENDDWWKVRNTQGQEGVVPASYVELTEASSFTTNGDGDAAAAEEEEEDAAVAAVAAEAERQKRAAEAAAQRRRREAEEKQARQKQERARRDALKAQPAPEPPKLEKRPSTSEINRAARNVAIPQGRSAPERPKDGGAKSKPSASKTRMWIDRTGQFKVEAEFLGFNQGKIRLHKINGVVIEVAVEKMSPADIQYVEDVTGKRLMPNQAEMASHRREHASRTQSSSSSSREDKDKERERRREMDRESRRRQESRNGPKRNVDWFEFFLAAGVDVDDCTRYAAAFERDKIDETVLADLDAGTLRNLGLREGDVIRVSKLIDRKYRRQPSRQSTTSSQPSTTAQDLEKQIRADEELARKLQGQEGAARRGDSVSPAPPQLFSGIDGTLKNNTRRGRPTPKTGTGSVDAASLAAVSESLARSATASPPVRVNTVSPSFATTPKRTGSSLTVPSTTSGFDDDAWTPRPPSTKPTSPAPVSSASNNNLTSPAPAPAPPVTPTPSAATSDPNSALFEKLAAMKPPSTGTSPGGVRPGATPANNSFLGQSALNPNAPRGPYAPVPVNQGLLQPLIPTTGTGQFVPTKLGVQPTGMMGMQMTGLAPQPTGWSSNVHPQMTGYNDMVSMNNMGGGMNHMNHMNMGMGMGIQPQSTGFNGMMINNNSSPMGVGQLNPQQTGFPGLSTMSTSMQPQVTGFSNFGQGGSSGFGQPQQQDDKDKFNASNIFQQMKTGQFAKDHNTVPQSSQKYDALRPQPTGFQPGGVIQPQFTGIHFGQPQQQQQQYQPGGSGNGYGGYGGY